MRFWKGSNDYDNHRSGEHSPIDAFLSSCEACQLKDQVVSSVDLLQAETYVMDFTSVVPISPCLVLLF
jgi:hypothetical protein